MARSSAPCEPTRDRGRPIGVALDSAQLDRSLGIASARLRDAPAVSLGGLQTSIPGRLVVVGLQLGRPDTTVLPALVRLVAEHRPDRLLVLVGPPLLPGRDSISTGVDEALAAFRDTHPGPIDLQLPPSPDAQRPSRTAPWQALDAGRLRRLRVRLLPPRHEITPGWVCTVAPDICTGQRQPGLAAINLARRTGTSIIIGGTDRSGMIGETTLAADGSQRTLWGMEVVTIPIGHGAGDKLPQAGLGILNIGPTDAVTATLIPVSVATPRPGRQRVTLDHP